MNISETIQHEAYTGSGEDEHGNPVDSWASPVALGIYAFNPGTTEEPALPGHDRVITTPLVYVPSDTILNPRDRVTVRGKTYEVDGDMLVFQNPFDASEDGNSINLKAVDG